MRDQQVFESVERELNRQRNNIELIASENFVSEEILELAGSVLTNKYAEGYPGKRYYGGCQFVDEVETLAINRLKKLFGCEYANVQPHSGAQANTAVYLALLNHGDKVLGMSRNEETLQPEEYYAKFPSCLKEADVIVLDPMLATGGSACAAITNIKKRGAKNIKFACLVAAPEGIQVIETEHSDVDLIVGALDEKLNDKGYIVPGLGDAGDRLFGTD